MKLIFCSECHDVVALRTEEKRSCLCGRASGYYKDRVNAVIQGSTAVPLAIENLDLAYWERAKRPDCAPFIRAWYIVPHVFDYPEIEIE